MNRLVLNFVAESNAHERMFFFDSSGKCIKTDLITLTKGNNQIEIPTAGLKAGLYMIALKIGKETIQKRIILSNQNK